MLQIIRKMNSGYLNCKSYKDPDARVVFENGIFYRHIFESFESDYEIFMNSGLYKKLVDSELIIQHIELKPPYSHQFVYKILLPDQIDFLSYPFEWSFEQWKKVILVFLKINIISLQYGMILKDASPYNFYFQKGDPILLDTTSFIKFNIDGDLWNAYLQFCEELLAPFALIRFCGQKWSRLLQSQIRGVLLDFASNQLPTRSWLNPACFLHIHVHAKFQYNNSRKNKSSKSVFSAEKLIILLTSIFDDVNGWEKSKTDQNHWSKYYQKNIESTLYLSNKEKLIKQWLDFIKPNKSLDLGANDGRFSRIAAKYSKSVIAIESDPVCVDLIDRMINQEKILNITALVADLSNPSPAMGVLNLELDSLIDRFKGDLLLALALIHHLCISCYMSLQQVVELFYELTTSYAIVEFIPVDDEKVKILMNSKSLTFPEYNEKQFVESFRMRFDLLESFTIDSSKRKLFLFKKLM
jgi:hypothetical protein